MIIKVKGNAINVTTANTVSDSNLVRIFATNAATITIAGSTAGTFNMAVNQTEIIEKLATDTIAATAAVSCTPISYKA
jgi:predicted Rdx family selenoprotein